MNKPIAMMYKDKLGTEFTSVVSSEILKHPKWIPLYTHPMRELSDEEIDMHAISRLYIK